MESVLKAVNQLELELRTAVDREKIRAEENSKKEIDLARKETMLGDWESKLNAREADVSKIENIVQMKQDAVALKAEGEALLRQAKIDRSANEKVNNGELTAIDQAKVELGRERAKLLEDKKLLKRAWDELKEAKQRYKDEVNREIVRRIGG